MKMKQLETLLLQEMEDVKGGSTAGVCNCKWFPDPRCPHAEEIDVIL